MHEQKQTLPLSGTFWLPSFSIAFRNRLYALDVVAVVVSVLPLSVAASASTRNTYVSNSGTHTSRICRANALPASDTISDCTLSPLSMMNENARSFVTVKLCTLRVRSLGVP